MALRKSMVILRSLICREMCMVCRAERSFRYVVAVAPLTNLFAMDRIKDILNMRRLHSIFHPRKCRGIVIQSSVLGACYILEVMWNKKLIFAPA